jgi:hypothetical protein
MSLPYGKVCQTNLTEGEAVAAAKRAQRSNTPAPRHSNSSNDWVSKLATSYHIHSRFVLVPQMRDAANGPPFAGTSGTRRRMSTMSVVRVVVVVYPPLTRLSISRINLSSPRIGHAPRYS